MLSKNLPIHNGITPTGYSKNVNKILWIISHSVLVATFQLEQYHVWSRMNMQGWYEIQNCIYFLFGNNSWCKGQEVFWVDFQWPLFAMWRCKNRFLQLLVFSLLVDFGSNILSTPDLVGWEGWSDKHSIQNVNTEILDVAWPFFPKY